MNFNCVKCGKDFESDNEKRKYCSLNCSKKTLKGLCRRCQKQITATRFYCKNCRIKNKEEGTERTKQQNRINAKKINRSFRGRHAILKKTLKREKVLESDLCWNLNFYTELIRDIICHYCLGPLNPTGHGLDRRDSECGHEAHNVVPCCWLCNSIKGKFWEYEHMMLLAPKLRRLRSQGRTRPMTGQRFRKAYSNGLIPLSGPKADVV